MLRALFILFFGTIFISALLTPWAYLAIEAFIGDSPWPFSRVYDRVAMLVALIFILILKKSFPLSEAVAAFKSTKLTRALVYLFSGIFLTLISVVLVVPILVYVTGDLIWNPASSAEIIKRAIKIPLSAILIAVIEEAFFRVLLLNKFREKFSKLLSILFCSLIYAAVHFIAPIKSWRYEEFHWYAGLDYIQQVAGQFFHPTVPPAFLGLFLVGIVLASTRLYFKSIWLCVGLHAGWVICVKAIRKLGYFNPDYGIPSGRISQYFLVSLPVAWASILAVGLVLYITYKCSKNKLA